MRCFAMAAARRWFLPLLPSTHGRRSALSDGSSGAADLLTVLIRAELANEFTNKASLEQRGFAVTTSAGTLITILFAIGTVVEGGLLAAAGKTRVVLLAALLCLIAAALAGIVANWPWKFAAIPVGHPGGLYDLLDPTVFYGDQTVLSRRIAEVHVDQIRSLRRVNVWKAKALLAGLTLEVLAVLCIAGVIAIRVI